MLGLTHASDVWCGPYRRNRTANPTGQALNDTRDAIIFEADAFCTCPGVMHYALYLNAAHRGTEDRMATQPSNEWIEWAGGECPVPKGTTYEAKLRNGWLRRGTVRTHKTTKWQHKNAPRDVVAYRVVSK